jgi:peptidoglycan/xylan/chitin deacetylase (PgdA/CDA1 family)
MTSSIPTVLRMDDPGASTKQFEQYAKLRFFGHRLPTPKVLHVGPLKRVPLWQGWGPYPELSAATWNEVLHLLRAYQAKMTVAVTAAWVRRDGSLMPFNERWPEQAELLRGAAAAGLVEIANHGLTHCVVEGGRFVPHPYKSNRRYHREFGASVPAEIQHHHLQRAQAILEQSFGVRPVTLVPPGNVWTADTERAAAAAGLRFLTSHESLAPTGHYRNGLMYIGETDTVAFHDREIALEGVEWLRKVLSTATRRYTTVVERGEELARPKGRPATFVRRRTDVRNNLGVYIRSVGERTKDLSIEAAIRAVPPEHVHVIEHVYPSARAYERMFLDARERQYRWFVGLDADVVLREDWLALVEAQIERLLGHAWYVFSFSVRDRFLENIGRGNHFYNGAYARRSLTVLQQTRHSLRPESTLRHFMPAQSPYMEDEWIGYHGYDQYYRDIFYRFWLRAKRSQTLLRPAPLAPFELGARQSLEVLVAQAGWRAGHLPYWQQVHHTVLRTLPATLPTNQREREALFSAYLPGVMEKPPLAIDGAAWYKVAEAQHVRVTV